MSEAITRTVTCENGETWTVNVRGDWLSIVDAQGRERHRSRGHDMTGIHLAMQLAKQHMEPLEGFDDALRLQAARFLGKEETQCGLK